MLQARNTFCILGVGFNDDLNVERTFGWMTRWRRLVRDYEQRTDVLPSYDPRRYGRQSTAPKRSSVIFQTDSKSKSAVVGPARRIDLSQPRYAGRPRGGTEIHTAESLTRRSISPPVQAAATIRLRLFHRN